MFPSLPTGLPTLPLQARPPHGAVAPPTGRAVAALPAKALPSLFDARA